MVGKLILLFLLIPPLILSSQTQGVLEDEYEPNDDFNHAYPVDCCKEMDMTLHSTNDTDWFSFVLEDDQIIRFFISYPDEDIQITIRLMMIQTSVIDEYQSSVELALEEGSYFFMIYSFEGQIGSYTIEFEFYLSPDDWEPNDEPAEAKKLIQDMSGSIHTPYDKDWFIQNYIK